METTKSTIIVVGNGMTGLRYCEKLVERGGHEQYNIIVFGEEPRPAYDRVHLTDYYTGTSIEDLTMQPRAWYDDHGITLYTGELVVELDRTNKTIKTHRGQELKYDKLVLATGSSPFVPPIQGIDKEGVFVYRTIEDLDAIKAYGKKADSAAVIGGGLLGLEAAKAVLDDGLKTSVIEFAPRLMPRQLDDAGAAILAAQMEDMGLTILCNKNTKEVKGDGKVERMDFTDGASLAVDMIVVSAGIKPRDELARMSGLEVGPRGGMVVNDQMLTQDPDVYAIGENALHRGMIYGLIAPCWEMAEVAVAHLYGEEKSFDGFDMSTKLKLIGTDVASFGDPFIEGLDVRTIVYENKHKKVYKRINISLKDNTLLGGVLVGDADDYNMLLQMTKNAMALPEDPEDLILGARGGEGGGMGVMDLPDDAMVCSCEAVTKGDIVGHIENGVTDLVRMKACCKAATGCGGCVPMVNDLIDESMKAAGATIRKVICEHFDHTRQELYDIVRVKEIKTYKELLNQYGTGSGCEVCKPAAASILASVWNEMVLENDHDTIQDTNDRYLANIQRGGTYSVVPRVAGGEITPDQLIALGTVANKYGLYTKITGGQRVDLFGAHVGDMPAIWEELIAVGFETGQAYGKSLRTVKSCVGSTWCRYGVQDSTKLAIDIENRYKGLRSPHKLKSAVSGCVRECAEAQSKDFGIIATDKGWNLFVCGNGGAKPQHASLLANDIDTETLIKYIDRFLMFYIKTAPPLTRTSVWFNKLEGGLDYLKSVVIDDALGICDELEAQMEHHVATYKCEWNEVVKDPAKRKKFAHFINSDQKDETVDFVPERTQKVPQPW